MASSKQWAACLLRGLGYRSAEAELPSRAEIAEVRERLLVALGARYGRRHLRRRRRRLRPLHLLLRLLLLVAGEAGVEAVADLGGEAQVGEHDVGQRGHVVLAIAGLDHLLLGYALLLPHQRASPRHRGRVLSE